MSHSKRNTSRAVFTSYERSIAKAAWGSNTARLSRDSFLPFASCCLCLLPARTPVSCPHGDIFCKECALKNILAQKQEIKRLNKNRLREEKEAEKQKEMEETEARLRSTFEFEKVQMGLESKLMDTRVSQENKQGKENSDERGEFTGKIGSAKRKFELDLDEVQRINKDEAMQAKKVIINEKAEKTSLPSFWVPSITPSSNTKNKLHHITKKMKLVPNCPASPESKPHSYSLHSLIEVVFTEEGDKRLGSIQRICPTCQKVLTNTSKAVLIVRCGHVLCGNCVSRFMSQPEIRDSISLEVDQKNVICFVCDPNLNQFDKRGEKLSHKKNIESIKSGILEIRCEGTGFAGGGLSTVKKAGVAFQC